VSTAAADSLSTETDPRSPVLVGVGTAQHEAEALDLMEVALREAALDATGHRERAETLLRAVEQVAVPRGTWAYEDPGRAVAQRVGAPAARTELVELGVPQQTIVNQALADIWAGRLEVAAVVGGEGRRWWRNHGGVGPAGSSPAPGPPDQTVIPSTDIVAPEEMEVGLIEPVAQYAMIENALRAAEHIDIAAHQACIAALWARFNEVARSNPRAAFPAPRTAADLVSTGGDNRALAWPYRKWHASQWTVDQAAALVMCSVEAARRLGVPPGRWVWPRVALVADHAVPLSRRRAVHRWPAMGVLGRTAVSHLGFPLSELPTVELYSCFPAAVQVQQRELALDPSGTPTVTGGMAFAGGPLNNFVYQATAALVGRLRATADRAGAPSGRDEERPNGAEGLGMVTTVSGLLTKPGLAVWSSRPGGPPLLGDLRAEAAAETDTVDVARDHTGPGTVVTYTVVWDRPPQPTRGGGADRQAATGRLVVLADIDARRRVLATSERPQLAQRGRTEELVGRRVEIRGNEVVAMG
jgi:acetyl-CoA C-acetyltransferase